MSEVATHIQLLITIPYTIQQI